jgi:type II secretory pathway component PulK
MSLTDTVSLGNERVAIAYHDPGARLNLNRASVDDLRRFLVSLPTDADDADRIAQRIADWRDADDMPHPRGAERADYLRNGARRLPSNAAFATLDELQSVDGITPFLFRRIAPHLTLLGVGQTNVNAAPAEVLHALPGFGDEAVAAMIGLQREHRIIRSLDELTRHLSRGAASGIAIAAPELASRVSFETQEIVVEATGWLDGSPVRVLGDMLVTRSGESVLVVSRHVRAQ